MRKHFLFRHLCLFILMPLFLAACSSQPPQQRDVNANTVEQALSPETLLAQAYQSRSSEQRAALFLRAAQQYWTNGLISQALAVYRDVDAEALQVSQAAQWLELGLNLGITMDEKSLLTDLLQPERLQWIVSQTSLDTQQALILLAGDGYVAAEDPIAAAILLADFVGIFPPDDLPLLSDRIWRTLQATPLNTLANAHTNKQDGTTGESSALWLALSLNLRQRQNNLEEQYQYLNEWQQSHPEHLASIHPPFELQVLAQLPDISPRVVTLALPFSGPLANVANAIRDGFLASHYQQASQQLLRIEMFDTNRADMTSLYTSPSEHSQLIIGPLDKATLGRVASLETLPIPTMALNTLDRLDQSPEGLFQFALAAEDEARQIARHLSRKDLRRVALIAPEGDFGDRIEQSFIGELSLHGGTLITQARYADQKSLATTVARMLATDRSKQRARKIRSITQLPLQSEPRRRQDIDAIFMVAKPSLARQLKPLFAFHYAKHLPVYSTSQIYARDGHGNDDLNGIKFVEMPWMLSSAHPVKAALQRHTPENAERYARFHALGADASLLAARLPILQQLPDSQVPGQSGALSLNEQGMIWRELQWATFKNGRAIPIKE